MGVGMGGGNAIVSIADTSTVVSVGAGEEGMRSSEYAGGSFDGQPIGRFVSQLGLCRRDEELVPREWWHLLTGTISSRRVMGAEKSPLAAERQKAT